MMVLVHSSLATLSAILLLCDTGNSFMLQRRNNAPRSIGKSHSSSIAKSPTDITVIATSYTTAGAQPPSFLRAIPEPGPCPQCSDENGYYDGNVNFVCIACGFEWPVEGDASSNESINEADGVVRDCNGNILENGDTVTLTKELGKGLKKGMKVTRIRVGDYGDSHDVEANLPGMGTFALKSQFLKKSGK